MNELAKIEAKNEVVFLSPGTFVSEQSSREVETWDEAEAVKMASEITERYNAKPYGFYFRRIEGVTRDDRWTTLKELERSSMFYLGGKVETLAEVEARATDADSVLLMNMRGNGIAKIITTKNGWRHTAEFKDGDKVVAWP